MSQNCLTTRRRFLQSVASIGAASVMIPATQRALGDQLANSRPVFACIDMRNQGWAITSKTIPFTSHNSYNEIQGKLRALTEDLSAKVNMGNLEDLRWSIGNLLDAAGRKKSPGSIFFRISR